MPNSLLYAAKVVFKLQSEAEQARATLEYARGLHSGESMFTNEHSGVLADGERLKVVIVPDQPRQPITTSAVPTGPASMRVARSNGTPSDLAMRLGLPGNNAIPPAATNSSRAIRPATLMPLARSIPDEPSKMRSDEVMRFDPRASIITQPAGVEEEEQRRGRGGRKSWRGAKGRRSAGGMDLD